MEATSLSGSLVRYIYLIVTFGVYIIGLLYAVNFAIIPVSVSICRRMEMSLAFKSNSVLEQEYATKGELHYGLHVSYERMAKAVREGKLAVHLIDGKVQLRVEEVVNLFFPPRKSLFD